VCVWGVDGIEMRTWHALEHSWQVQKHLTSLQNFKQLDHVAFISQGTLADLLVKALNTIMESISKQT